MLHGLVRFVVGDPVGGARDADVGADTVLGVQAGRMATPSRWAAYDLDAVAHQLQDVAILADDTSLVSHDAVLAVAGAACGARSKGADE